MFEVNLTPEDFSTQSNVGLNVCDGQPDIARLPAREGRVKVYSILHIDTVMCTH